MTINIKDFFSSSKKISKMGDFQELKDIEGLQVSAVSANLYKNGRDDLSLFYFPDGANYAVVYTKNSIVSEFITAGFKVDKEGELSKMSQAKINLFSRIYSHKKIQALIKDCTSNQSVIDVLISKKLASQGKLRKFIDGSKGKKTLLELFYNAYKVLDEDEKQEGIIWINATAKGAGFQTTQKELDEVWDELKSSVNLDPLALVRWTSAVSLDFNETPEQFYFRTSHVGNIGVRALDEISSFVESSLQLEGITPLKSVVI